MIFAVFDGAALLFFWEPSDSTSKQKLCKYEDDWLSERQNCSESGLSTLKPYFWEALSINSHAKFGSWTLQTYQYVLTHFIQNFPAQLPVIWSSLLVAALWIAQSLSVCAVIDRCVAMHSAIWWRVWDVWLGDSAEPSLWCQCTTPAAARHASTVVLVPIGVDIFQPFQASIPLPCLSSFVYPFIPFSPFLHCSFLSPFIPFSPFLHCKVQPALKSS